MRDYELTFIVRTLATDEEVNQAINQVISFVEQGNNGRVKSIDRKLFGRRRLAYEIDGQRDGHYVLVKTSINPDHLDELETELKLFDPVLRYLLVRDETKKKEPVKE
jgi:small subunit ribosomal protein S6